MTAPMRRFAARFVGMLTWMTLLAGCATVSTPPRISQPWLREDERAPGLPAGATIQVAVDGQRDVLPGSPDFANAEMAERLAASLARRGYKVLEDRADYEVKLSYRTRRHEYTANYSEFSSRSANQTLYRSSVRSHTSPAVAIAALVGAFASASSQSTQVTQWSDPEHYFSHAAAISARSRDGELVWQAETVWESSAIDISDDVGAFLVRATSSLPRDPEHFVDVPVLASQKTRGYYLTYCSGRTFSCPALPYRIRFAPVTETDSSNQAQKGKWNDSELTTRSANWRALPAYLDLIKNAEDALPVVKNVEDADVLASETWSRVTLASRYLLGPDRTPTHVMIRLKATSSNYVVTQCDIVTEADYDEYSANLVRWRARVDAFWDFYER